MNVGKPLLMVCGKPVRTGANRLAAVLIGLAAHLSPILAGDDFSGQANRVESVLEQRPFSKGKGRQQKDRADSAKDALDRHVRVIRKGSSNRSARKKALANLPLNLLDETSRQRADKVLKSIALFRQLPTLECSVEPAVSRYFAKHPDVAVSIWRAMKISTFQMIQTGPRSYDVDSGDGTTAVVDVLYQGGDETLVICNGVFKTPLLLRPIKATGLFYLQTESSRMKNGTSASKLRGSMFVAFPSQTVGTVAKVISPVSNIIVDRNFREVSLFLHMMSVAMQRQPGWVEHIANKLDGVSEPRKTELLKLTARMYVASNKRRVAASADAEDVDMDQLLLPLITRPSKTAPRVVSKPKPMGN